MKLRKSVVSAVGFGVASLVASIGLMQGLQGCSSSDNNGGGGGTDAGVDQTGTVPPVKPSGPATTSTDEHNFAVRKLVFGEGDAWKSIGYNLDGKISSEKSTDVCTPVTGGKLTVHNNGTGGIDNSFGQFIVPIITGVQPDAESKINDSLEKGTFTVMLDTVGLGADDQTATGLTARLYAGANFDADGDPNATGKTPTWTTADNWPVSPDFVNGGTAGNVSDAKVKFSDAYVVSGTWVNGSTSDVLLNLSLSGVTLPITVHQARITFKHQGSKAVNGIIAGVLDTEELVKGLSKVAGNISTGLCSGGAFDNIAAQIRQASDILSDGTNKAGTTCNAISIGVGFEADEIGVPQKVASPAKPGPDPCNPTTEDDGGTGDSGTQGDSGSSDAKAD